MPPKLYEETEEFESFDNNPLDELDRWVMDEWLPEHEDDENE